MNDVQLSIFSWKFKNMQLKDYDLEEDDYVPRGALNRQYPKGKFNSWVEIDRGVHAPYHNTRQKLEPGVD